MLSSLCIKNYTTVQYAELDFANGFTTITGETGAGKSVLLDSLALALGGRSARDVLRDETQPAEFSAVFSFAATTLPSEVKTWLETRELQHDEECELVLRRVLKADGRSKAFVNSSPATLSDLQSLGELLLDLHSQHEYQSLLKRSTQQHLLDDFAGNRALLDDVCSLAEQWQAMTREIERLQTADDKQQARLQLLSYQVEELDLLAPQADEVAKLESEQKMLAQAENLLTHMQQAREQLQNDESSGALDACSHTARLLEATCKALPELQSTVELIESARIQLDEALDDIERLSDRVVIDPERLQLVEQRLDTLYTIARKHHCPPEQLVELHQTLLEELDTLTNSDQRLELLLAERDQVSDRYSTAASQLSKKRQTAAKKLTKTVSEKLSALNMAHCDFTVNLQAAPQAISPNGKENIEFLISTIPGKPPAALSKIASGGELSRISLAIQVVTAQTSRTPTLVFDEVDVGIGGATAEVVGKLLRELGEHCQVFCVTHQAQVAARGHQHLLVSKQLSKKTATTRFELLDKENRTRELARMIGGKDLTESTLAHAAEVLETA